MLISSDSLPRFGGTPIVAAAILLFISAMPASTQEDDQKEKCARAGFIAGFTMEERQQGLSPIKVIGHLTSNFSGDPTKRKNMALEAFDIPRATTKEGRLAAIENYRNDYELRCLRGDVLE